jgi:two-component sensor histidine kinase
LVQAEAVALDLDAAVPVGLIVNELITNALKYAFAPDAAGTIRIHFAADGPDHLLLVVGDDGVGMDATRASPGVTSTLGLRMVRSLTRQLKGQLEIDTQRGTAVRVRFPRPTHRQPPRPSQP